MTDATPAPPPVPATPEQLRDAMNRVRLEVGKAVVGQDGTVSVTISGNPAAQVIGNVQTADFINPAGLQSQGGNLFLETASSGAPTPNTPGLNGAGILNHPYVETSNVNVAEELVSMIQTQRAYELNSKVVSTSDQMLARLTQL